ncbi:MULTISPECIES: helix-turn-helix domain-containing protein [Lactobacillus]|nr:MULTISPECIES: helix-turn-helix transcriptional regulator [Lactobacillus]
MVDLSKLSGISTRSLEWYVKQERQPSLERVEKLAKALEVSPAWLVSWKD